MSHATGHEMEKCKILFLAANPQGTTPLALDKEIREIETKIRGERFGAEYVNYMKKAWTEATIWVSPKYQDRLSPEAIAD